MCNFANDYNLFKTIDMKKMNFKVAAVLLAGTLLSSSCIGSFSLFNKYEKWQCNMTGNKFVNGIVGIILQPVMGLITLSVDALVLNTIEFWTGNNPLAVNTTQQIKGQDGRYYAVTTLKDGYRIEAPSGEVTLLLHDAKNDSWSMQQNGVTKEIFRFNADGTLQATLADGKTITITADEAGLQQVRQSVMAVDGFYAQR